MSNRKKRLKKGIESIKKSIEEHEEKRNNAMSDDDEDLVDYYTKEIEGMKDQVRKKEEILDK